MIRAGWVVAFVGIVGCAALDKAPPTDAPEVDDVKADSLRAPTMMSGNAGDFTSGTRYLGMPITLAAGQPIAIRAGGYDASEATLDTVVYLYGPKDAHGRRGAYLARNDDRSDADVASRIDAVATKGAGEYLIVVTTYHKPDPGRVVIETDCATCFDTAGGPAGGGAPQPTRYVDARPFLDPEMAAAGSIDAYLAALDAEAADGDPLTIASSVQSLLGGRKWPLDQVDRVHQAAIAALPSATAFASWSDRAHGVLLTTERVFTEAAATKPPAWQPIADALAATWPGSTWHDDAETALMANGRVYGYRVDFQLTNANGDQWDAHEYFTRTGRYLGDFGGDFGDPD